MRYLLSVMLLCVCIVGFAEQKISNVLKVTHIKLLPSPDTSKLIFRFETIYQVPSGIDIYHVENALYLRAEKSTYEWYANSSLIYRLTDIEHNPGFKWFKSYIAMPISHWVNIQNENYCRGIWEIQVNKESMLFYRLYEDQIILANPDTAEGNIAEWQIYIESFVEDYQPFTGFLKEDIDFQRIKRKDALGKQTIFEKFPMIIGKGTTQLTRVGDKRKEYNFFFLHKGLNSHNSSRSSIEIKDHQMIKVTDYQLSKNQFESKRVGFSHALFNYPKRHGDLKFDIQVSHTPLTPTLWSPEDFIRKTIELDFDEPIYSVLPSNNGQKHRFVYCLKDIKKGEVIETTHSLTYHAERCFSKCDSFTTKFTYANISGFGYNNPHRITFKYPSNQTLIEYDTLNHSLDLTNHEITYEYKTPQDIPSYTTLVYQNEHTQYLKFCRFVGIIGGLFSIIIIPLIMLIFHLRISKDLFEEFIKYMVMINGFLFNGVYLVVLLGFISDQDIRVNFNLTYGYLIVAPFIIYSILYGYIVLMRRSNTKKSL